MKMQTKLLLGVLSAFVVVSNAAYADKDCGRGQYNTLGDKCRTCPAGCYCPQEKKDVRGHDSNSGRVADYCSSRDYGKLGSGERKGAGSYFILCPEAYPNSEAGSGYDAQCYKTEGDVRVFNETKDCPAGTYLEAKESPQCLPCTSIQGLKPNEYCPGGILNRKSVNSGIETCPDKTEPNAERTECDVPSIKCAEGEYRPRNSMECKSCKDKSDIKPKQYCPGGDLKWNETQDVGLENCGEGKIGNFDRTDCVEGDENGMKCKPGQFMPAGGKKCQDCGGGSAYYCPGGYVTLQPTSDMGRYECPKGGWANTQKTGCDITLSIEQLMQGADTSQFKDCWLLSDNVDSYTECLFGASIE